MKNKTRLRADEEVIRRGALDGLGVEKIGENVWFVVSEEDFEIRLGVFLMNLKRNKWMVRVSRKIDDKGCLVEIFKE